MRNIQAQEKSLLPLLTVIAAVAAPLIFILGLAFGANFGNKEGLIGGSISDWLTATATIAVTALTFVLAKESWQLRLLQIAQIRELQLESIRPNVSVHLEPSHVGVNFMNVKVSNLGKGIARQVMFELIDRNGTLISQGQNKVVDKFLKLAVFRKGVQSLGVNQVITSFLFSVPQLSGEIGGKIFEQYVGVRTKFQDVEGNDYINEFSIDFAELEGITELGGSPIYNISMEIKKIREQLRRSLGSSARRIGVDVYTSTDREAELEERVAWIEEQKAAAKLAAENSDVKT
ncbi:hypothetical protein [Aeromonas hydrophila]|uniref:hypothetical protein n=1 Tax=Aeromonas hydrophila TaxID=644 RepID=UPI003EC5E381